LQQISLYPQFLWRKALSFSFRTEQPAIFFNHRVKTAKRPAALLTITLKLLHHLHGLTAALFITPLILLLDQLPATLLTITLKLLHLL